MAEFERVDLPTGYDFAIKTSTDLDWLDLGPTAQDGSLEFSFDTIKATASKAQKIKTFYKNMQITITASFYQQFLEKVNKLMGGAGSYSTVAGTLVTGHVQTFAANTWAREVFIPFNRKQAAGTAPASLVVTNPGSLVLGTDYIVSKSGDDWGVTVLATRGVLTNNLVFTYNYTPAAQEIITVGSASVDITAYEVRIRKPIEGTGKYQTMYIYSAANEGGFTFGFPRYDVDDVPFQEVSLVGTVDVTRSDMDQLFRIERDL
jgi:hypothetical protein